MEGDIWTRSIGVEPDRLAGWLDRFAARHGAVEVSCASTSVELHSPDGAAALIHLTWGTVDPADPLRDLLEQAAEPRRIGALIVHRQAHAVAIYDGADLVRHRIGRHYVQGRTKAGGWSQQRYARRRENQSTKAFAAAAADVHQVLLPAASSLAALITLGDRRGIATILADPEFGELSAPALDRGLGGFSVPDPRLQLLIELPTEFRKVRIELNSAA